MQDIMMGEILEQPAILSSLLQKPAFYKNFINQLEGVRRVILTGCGDSYCAALAGSYAFSSMIRDCLSLAVRPMELTFYHQNLLDSHTLVIGISVSGKTPRVEEALRCARAKGALISGLTDNPNSPISDLTNELSLVTGTSPPEALETSSYATAEAAQYTGYHHDCAQTKTYLANVFALLLIAASWAQNEDALSILDKQPDNVASVVKGEIAEEIRKSAESSATYEKAPIMLASGPNRANALFGSYKGNEFATATHSQEIEEYCHNQYFVTEENTSVVFLAPEGPSLDRTLEITPVLRDVLNARPIIFTSPQRPLDLLESFLPLPYSGPECLSTPVYSAAVGLWWYYWAKKRGFDTNRFRGGIDAERYVEGSLRTIRKSKMKCID